MRLYLREELVRFLEAADAALERSLEVVVIGGAAAAVHYGSGDGTRDIDTWTVIERDLAAAFERARQVTGLPVPFGKSGVADGPFNMEERFERTLPALERLVVKVPEKHDLALMKIIRGDERDMNTIQAIHRRSPLDLEVLIRRYGEEMNAVVGDPIRLRGNFLVMSERLFPESVESVPRRLPRASPLDGLIPIRPPRRRDR